MKTKPGELVIGTSEDRILVRIQRDGTIEYGPEYTPDEAAKVFWEALAKQRQDNDVNDMVSRQVMDLVKKVGAQDLRYERCQLAAKDPDASEHDRFQEERVRAQMESYVHQLIELARGIALRDEINDASEKPAKELN